MFVSGDFDMRSYQLDDSVIANMVLICDSVGIESEIYRRFENKLLIVVKSISQRYLSEERKIKKEIGKLINLCHPCIAASIPVLLCPFFQRWDSRVGFCVFRLCFWQGRELCEFRPQVFQTELFAHLDKPRNVRGCDFDCIPLKGRHELAEESERDS
jgi:hypothetical protein